VVVYSKYVCAIACVYLIIRANVVSFGVLAPFAFYGVRDACAAFWVPRANGENHSQDGIKSTCR
jgi:hypothetical protein